MASTKISALPAATTPLAGTEVLPMVQSTTTVKVATDDLTVKNIRSNATTGIAQIVGPAAGTTRTITMPNANTTLPQASYIITFSGITAARTITLPDANFTAARTDAAQTFTGTQTVQVASTNDAVALAGRAGGTGSYIATITPSTLSASRTVTIPDANTTLPVATQVLTFSGPTAARTITLPDANFTAARTDAAQSFTGNQTLSTGNLVIGTSGKGIDFSATSDPGGMTSEILADYEEGTFTPTIFGSTSAGTGTYTNQTGRYTKVGNRVYININVAWTAHTGTGNSRFGGLPYTSANVSFTAATFTTAPDSYAMTAANIMTAQGLSNTTNGALYQMPTGGGAQAEITLDTSARVIITGFYEV